MTRPREARMPRQTRMGTRRRCVRIRRRRSRSTARRCAGTRQLQGCQRGPFIDWSERFDRTAQAEARVVSDRSIGAIERGPLSFALAWRRGRASADNVIRLAYNQIWLEQSKKNDENMQNSRFPEQTKLKVTSEIDCTKYRNL